MAVRPAAAMAIAIHDAVLFEPQAMSTAATAIAAAVTVCRLVCFRGILQRLHYHDALGG
jgi:hypothetical protein